VQRDDSRVPEERKQPVAKRRRERRRAANVIIKKYLRWRLGSTAPAIIREHPPNCMGIAEDEGARIVEHQE